MVDAPPSGGGARQTLEFSSRKRGREVNLVNRASFSGEHRKRVGLETLKLKVFRVEDAAKVSSTFFILSLKQSVILPRKDHEE